MRLKSTKYSRLIYHPPVPDKEAKKQTGVKISDTLLLGFVPLLGYGLLFGFYSPYFDYFGIPYDFMSFDLPKLLVCIIGLLIIGMYLSLFLDIINKPISRFKSKYLKRFII